MSRKLAQAEQTESPGEIRADSLYTLRELCRRLGWGETSLSKARRKGLPSIELFAKRYYRGRDVLAFFDQWPA